MLTRIITAIIGIIAAVGIITYGGWLFGAAVLLLALLGWNELRTMAAPKDLHLYPLTGACSLLLLLGLAVAAALGSLRREHFPAALLAILTLSLLGVALEGILRRCHLAETRWLEDVALNAFGLFYCGLLFIHVLLVRSLPGPSVNLIRSMDYGEAFLWTVLLGTWASDTFAYFVGRFLGRHKFCSISPNKTWEGVLGGFCGSMALVIYLSIQVLGLPALWSCLLGLAIATVAPIGDLVESVIKRCLNAKDSGKLLPGHGGVLDRFDSLLFTAPTAYYIFWLYNLLA